MKELEGNQNEATRFLVAFSGKRRRNVFYDIMSTYSAL
jgi:hypothetical protein